MPPPGQCKEIQPHPACDSASKVKPGPIWAPGGGGHHPIGFSVGGWRGTCRAGWGPRKPQSLGTGFPSPCSWGDICIIIVIIIILIFKTAGSASSPVPFPFSLAGVPYCFPLFLLCFGPKPLEMESQILRGSLLKHSPWESVRSTVLGRFQLSIGVLEEVLKCHRLLGFPNGSFIFSFSK